MSAEVERRGKAFAYALRCLNGVSDVLYMFEDDRKLIASKPRYDVARAKAGLEPSRGRNQQLIADLVAQAVVYNLEAVQIQEQHSECIPLALLNFRQRMSQAFHKQHAIRQ